MKHSKFTPKKRIKSFSYAFAGLKLLLKEEHNIRILTVITICTIALGFVLSLSLLEWVSVAIVIGLVYIAETLNTAIERVADFIHPENHDSIKNIKDIAAAAALVACIIAAAVGMIIFIPKLISMIIP